MILIERGLLTTQACRRCGVLELKTFRFLSTIIERNVEVFLYIYSKAEQLSRRSGDQKFRL